MAAHLERHQVSGRISISAPFTHPKEIQELCGHASIGRTLNVYGHLFEGWQDRLAERLADTFRASRAAWMRPERGPDVVEMHRAEMK